MIARPAGFAIRNAHPLLTTACDSDRGKRDDAMAARLKKASDRKRKDGTATPLRSTVFDFEHKVFSLPEAHFRMSSTGEALFNVNLGSVIGSLTPAALRGEFGIAVGTHDWTLLDVVERGLKFVKEIRAGDSIPTELLDGTASWSVDPKHKQIAEGRLMLQIARWLEGDLGHLPEAHEIEVLATDPELKKRAQAAFDKIAVQIGLGEGKKEDIVRRIDTLARELAYIEALRERFGKVSYIFNQLGTLNKLYHRDKVTLEDIIRIQALMRRPVEKMAGTLDMVDAQTAEIINVLKTIQTQIAYIREARDDLHVKLTEWDEVIDYWTEAMIERSPEMDDLLGVTYRFVALNFPISNDWRRG
jgi:hypothetical protein